jgi:hypothetical protein
LEEVVDYFKCPKCRGRSWIEKEEQDYIQRCLCGLFKYLQREIDGVTILSTAVSQLDVKLPPVGTKIYKCLLAVANSYPKPINTQEIAYHAQLKDKETAALVVMLRVRGIVERKEERRGIKGGSVWELTSIAVQKMNLLKGV